MHSVHTQLTLAARMVRPGCAQCAQAVRARRALGRVLAVPRPCRSLAWPCRRPCVARLHGRVVALCRDTTPCLMPLLVTIHILYHDLAQRPSFLLPYHDTNNCIVTHLNQSNPHLCHDTKRCIATQSTSHPGPRPCHDTMLCIVTHLSSQAMSVRAAGCVMAPG